MSQMPRSNAIAQRVVPTPASTGTVSRALQLLAVLADAKGPVAVKHVANTMGLAPSTAHRLLQLLRKEGFVDAAASGRLYDIGAQFYRSFAQQLGATADPIAGG